MKPVSAHTSPSYASSRAPRQRRPNPPAAAAAVMTRPVTYHAQQLQTSQAPTTSGQDNLDSTIAPIDVGQRPTTWHPTVDGGYESSADMSSQSRPRYQSVDENFCYGKPPYQYYVEPAYTNGCNVSRNQDYSTVGYPTQISQQWHQPGTSWFDSSTQDGTDGNSLPMESLNLNQMPTSTAFASQQGAAENVVPLDASNNRPQFNENLFQQPMGNNGQAPEDDDNDNNGELIGMGLHDATTNFEQTSLLLGAGLDEHEKPSPTASPNAQYSSLTSDCSPPEQVPDTIPDEGDETPVTNDIQDFSSPFPPVDYHPYNMTQTTQFPEQTYQPQMYDMSGQSFFFDDGNDAGGTVWYQTSAKTLPVENMVMYPWGWMGQQGGF